MSTTYGEQRTEAEKLYDAAVLERVKRGIAFLEREHGPNWVDKIDLYALDLSEAAACVLGQVYADHVDPLDEDDEYGDGYTYAVSTIDDLFDNGDTEHGFCITPFTASPAETHYIDERRRKQEWAALQQAWEDVLTPMIKKGDDL